MCCRSTRRDQPISTTAAFPSSSTVASEIGTYHEMSDSSGTKGHAWGRYLVAFRKDTDGMWRLVYLIGFPDSTRVDK